MAHGQPDFGMYASKAVVGSLADMGELAARLGSIVNFDRRGSVIFLDDFEGPSLRWRTGASAGVPVVALSEDTPKSGTQGVKLTTPAVLDGWVTIHKGVPHQQTARVGAEISFSYPVDDSYFWVNILVRTGSRVLIGKLAFNYGDEKLYYYDSGDNPVELAKDIKVHRVYFYYYVMKLVIDIEKEKYVRAIFNSESYDLSSYSLQAADSDLAPVILPTIQLTTEVAGARSSYFDDFILTIEEP